MVSVGASWACARGLAGERDRVRPRASSVRLDLRWIVRAPSRVGGEQADERSPAAGGQAAQEAGALVWWRAQGGCARQRDDVTVARKLTRRRGRFLSFLSTPPAVQARHP